jgi:hypothetical protein
MQRGEIEFGLNEIAINLRFWLNWNQKERDRENLTTNDDTAIICVPPNWPSRGAFKLWAETIEAARDALQQEG